MGNETKDVSISLLEFGSLECSESHNDLLWESVTTVTWLGDSGSPCVSVADCFI